MTESERERRIAEHRRRQPLPELERKARKARTRANLWTQEELDAIKVRAHEMYVALWRTP